MKDDGGSLFDLNKDPLPMIAKIMGEEMGLQRLTSAQKEIAKEIGRLKKLYNAKAGRMTPMSKIEISAATSAVVQVGKHGGWGFIILGWLLSS